MHVQRCTKSFVIIVCVHILLIHIDMTTWINYIDVLLDTIIEEIMSHSLWYSLELTPAPAPVLSALRTRIRRHRSSQSCTIIILSR